MALSGFNIKKLNGQLGLQEPLDTGTSGMLLFETSGDFGSDPIKLLSIEAAEELGITAEHDALNNQDCHLQISRYFKRTASPLWVIFHEDDMRVALDPSEGYSTALLNAAQGDIRQLAVASTMSEDPAGLTGSLSEELLFDVTLAIIQAQSLYNWALERYRPIDIWVAGRAFTGAAASALDVRSVLVDHASLSILQDKAGYDTVAANMSPGHVVTWADIGTPLGMESRSQIDVKYGRPIPADDLTIPADGIYTTPMIAGTAIDDIDESVLTELDNKGYVFARRYVDFPGAYIEDLPCATPITSDYNIRPYGRIWNEASRRLYKGMLPLVKSKVPLDASGLMVEGIADNWKLTGERALQALNVAGAIEGLNVTIDRQGKKVGNKTQYTVRFAIRVTEYADIIEGEIGLSF